MSKFTMHISAMVTIMDGDTFTVEAGGTVREARELLARSLEALYLLGYDSGFTNQWIDTLTTDIKKFLEDTI